LLGELQASRNIAGVISQKNADGVFFLSNLPLQIRNLCGGGVHQLLGLPDVQQRIDPVLLQGLRQIERMLVRR